MVMVMKKVTHDHEGAMQIYVHTYVTDSYLT